MNKLRCPQCGLSVSLRQNGVGTGFITQDAIRSSFYLANQYSVLGSN